MKVLFGVDGSSAGFAALEQVSAWLSPASDKVVLYYSVPDIRFQATSDEDEPMRERARKALSEAVFAEARGHLPEALRVGVESIVDSQHPGHGLVEAADQCGADLIVVGAHGTGSGAKQPLGTIARAVVHGASVPVLVARRAAAGQAPTVVLGWDGSDPSRAAAEFLKQFSWPAGTVGRVAAVIESMYAAQLPKWLEERARSADAEAMAQVWKREHEAERQAKHTELAALAQTLPKAFRGQEPIVAEGHPAEQIVATAAQVKAGLIVLGSHGHGAWGRLLLGSTSDKVLPEAPCSVLIVRSRGT